MNAAFKTVIRALISIGLLAYLIYLAEPAKILAVLSRIWYDRGIGYLTVAFALFILSQLILAVRWQLLVRGYGLNVPTHLLLVYYLIGLFFNNFLPTSIGGDVLRIYHLIKRSGERTIGFASVITERLLGVTATLILALVSLFMLSDQFNTYLLILFTFLLLAAIFLFFISVFNNVIFERFAKLIEPVKIMRLGERTIKFLGALRFYRNSKIIYVKILLISIFNQSVIIMMTYFLALALGIKVSLLYMFFVVPVTFLLTMLPSINGFGVREGGFVLLLGKVGISQAAAVSLSFMAILVPMFISIFGGILFMMQKRMPNREEIQSVEKNL